MQRHIHYRDDADRYLPIGIAVFSFIISLILVGLVFLSMMSLSVMSQ